LHINNINNIAYHLFWVLFGFVTIDQAATILQTGPKNWGTLFCTPYSRQILTDFQMYFT